ncbi:MAG TPA: hypothetical protein VD978_31325 [Azospirillum sp.]|nr:hypothetical protein [Azospirillum sp.]
MDFAFHPKDGTMYAVTVDALYTLDPTTAKLTKVAYIGVATQDGQETTLSGQNGNCMADTMHLERRSLAGHRFTVGKPPQ